MPEDEPSLDRLALRGIASVRFDTRGAGTTALGADVLEYGFEARLADARSCCAVAQELAGSRPLVLLGHSEGGVAGLALAVERPPAGVVLLATPARPIPDVLRDQIEASGRRLGLSADALEARLAEFDAFVEAVRSVGDADWAAGNVDDRIVAERGLARYLREMLSHDVPCAVRSLLCPLLVVHGADDEQVPVEDAYVIERLARQAGVDVRLVVLPKTGHLLKSASSPPSSRDLYDRRRRVKPEVVDAIATWLQDLVA